MSTQLSLLDQESDIAPQGLECHSEFVSPAEEAELLGRIDHADWLTDIARRVAHFGYKYDYSNRRLDDSARIGPLPEWLLWLARRARTTATPDIADLLDAEQAFVAGRCCVGAVTARRHPRGAARVSASWCPQSASETSDSNRPRDAVCDTITKSNTTVEALP